MTNALAPMIGLDSAGSLDAPAIVFLHGASHTRKAWLPQIQHLSDEFRVYSLDLLGHGDHAKSPFEFDKAVSDVHTFLQSLGKPALVVGVSLGGCVAMELVRRDAQAVAGLVISGSTFDARGRICRVIFRGEAIVFKAGEQHLTRQFHTYLRRTQTEPMANAIIAAGAHWHSAARAVLQLSGRDFIGCVRHYYGPVLILNGRRDWVHRSAERAFAAGMHNARIESVAGGGHISNLDRPKEFSEAVRRFARSAFKMQSVESV